MSSSGSKDPFTADVTPLATRQPSLQKGDIPQGKGDPVAKGDILQGTGDILQGTGDIYKGTGDIYKGTGDIYQDKGDIYKGKGDIYKGKGDIYKGKGDILKKKGDRVVKGDIHPSKGLVLQGKGDISPDKGDMLQGKGDIYKGKGDIYKGKGDISPDKGDILKGKRDTSPGKGAISPDKGDISPNKGDISPGKGDISPGKGDISPGKGDISSGTGDIFQGKEDIFPGKGDIYKGKGDIYKGKGDTYKGKGDILQGKGDILEGKGDRDGKEDISPGKGDILQGKGDISPDKGDILQGKGDISPRRGDISPRRGDISPRRGDISPRKGDRVAKEDISSGKGDIPEDKGDIYKGKGIGLDKAFLRAASKSSDGPATFSSTGSRWRPPKEWPEAGSVSPGDASRRPSASFTPRSKSGLLSGGGSKGSSKESDVSLKNDASSIDMQHLPDATAETIQQLKSISPEVTLDLPAAAVPDAGYAVPARTDAFSFGGTYSTSVSPSRTSRWTRDRVFSHMAPSSYNCLTLSLGSVRQLEVTPHPGSGRRAPREALSGITECEGTFGAAGSLFICCVLWTPMEDPLEVFSISQGTFWLPGWGRRVTSAVCTRACADRNALGQDEADVHQQLEMPFPSALALRVKGKTVDALAASAAANEFEGGAPVAFLSVLQIHEELKHDLGLSHNPFRSAGPSVTACNIITNEATPVFIKKPCLSFLGTAILPLDHLLAESRKTIEKLDFVKREATNPMCVSFGEDGKLRPSSKLKLFQHKEIWQAVTEYQNDLHHHRNVCLLSLLSSVPLVQKGLIELSLLSFKFRPIDWVILLGSRWKAKSSPGQSSPLSLNDDLRRSSMSPDPMSSSPEPPESPRRSLDIVRRVWIELKSVRSLPLIGPAKGVLQSSSVSVVAAWLPESRNQIYFKRFSRKVDAERCELEAQPLDVIVNVMRAKEEIFGHARFNAQVMLPTLPGLNPVLCLFVCVDGKPYAKLQDPLDLRLLHSMHASEGPEGSYSLSLALTNCQQLRILSAAGMTWCAPMSSPLGFLDVVFRLDPPDGLFLTSEEFGRLPLGHKAATDQSLKGPGQPGNHSDFYGAPVVSPYGQWSVFFSDVQLSDEEKDERQGSSKSAKKRSTKASSFFSPAVPLEAGHPQKPQQKTFLQILEEVEAEDRERAARLKAEKEKKETTEANLSPRGPGPVLAEMCVAQGTGLLSGVAGDWCVFSLKPKNKAGATVTNAEGSVRLALESLGYVDLKVSGDPWDTLTLIEGSTDLKPCVSGGSCNSSDFSMHPQLQWEVRENVFGKMTIRYKYDIPGKYNLHVTYDGLPIAGAPFELILTSGAPCPLASRVVGRGARMCFASPSALDVTPELRTAKKQKKKETLKNIENSDTDGDEDGDEDDVLPKAKTTKFKHFINQFKVVVCDVNGNRVPIGGHCLTVRGSQGARVLRVRDEGTGVYTVDYVVRAPRSILEASVKHLRLADTVANMLTSQQQLEAHDLIEQCKALQKEGALPFTSCRLDVLLFEKPLIASPLKPLVGNLEQMQTMYLQAQAATQLGASIDQFEDHLRKGKHNEAARILECVYQALKSEELHKEAEAALKRISLRDALNQGLELESDSEKSGDEEIEELQPLTEKQKIEKQKIRGLQQQWEEIQSVRELLLKISKDTERQQQIMQAFTEAMLFTLQRTQARNLRLLAEKHDYVRLRDENLLHLADMLQREYLHMFKKMTMQIMFFVTSLKNRDFFNLEELLNTYRKIAGELRLLHRYSLAKKFDDLCCCICEEIELQRLQHIYDEKQKLCKQAEDIIAAKEQELKQVQIQHKEKFKEVEPLNLEEVAEICITREQKAVQTEDALSLREGAFGPLIVARATGQRTKEMDPVCSLAKLHWCTCNPFEIHTSIRRLLKSTPRVKHCLQEIFAFYSRAPRKALLEKWESVEGLTMGLTQPAFYRLCLDLKLQENLLADPTQLTCFFEKFSVEPDEGLIRPEGFMRVLPLFLWLPCIRELAYLNLVHALSAEVVENDMDPDSSALKLSHPSRLIAFHHFCTFHLVPLYEHLYNNRDFALSIAPLMPDGQPMEVSRVADRGQNFVDVVAYGKEKLPVDVFSMLLLEPLEHLFVFYSELSMNPSLSRYREDDVSPLALTRRKAAEAAREKELASITAATQKRVKGKRKQIFSNAKLPIELRATPATIVTVLPNKEETEDVSPHAWVSAGVFIRMLRELGILPGFLSLQAARSIAFVSSIGGGQPQQPSAEGETTVEPESTKGRMVFVQFVEGIVQCICECTVSNLLRRLQRHEDRSAREEPDSPSSRTAFTSIAEIREEARQLLDIFGLVSLPSVLILTKRPLQKAIHVDEGDAGEKQKPVGTSSPRNPRAIAGLRMLTTFSHAKPS